MAGRAPGSPPQLDGYRAEQLIGSGGFADVYLYTQLMPEQPVAVKVLRQEALDRGAQDFIGEATLMARVRHPYIVQVHGVRETTDGRPCLVMEYYPGDNYYVRTRERRERFTVPEVLETGVRLAAAVETAHIAGVLHRDIKPANILTDEYRRPGLTDFGIASADGREDHDAGVSLPWAPPEALGEGPIDARSDVYSLAATLYDLLTGRAPFEVRGGDNGPEALMSRVESFPVPPTGLDEVPASLERVLGQAMAKRPDHRPASARAFAQLLQSVEAELELAVTPIELADTAPAARTRNDGDEDATYAKRVHSIDAQAEGAASSMIAVPDDPVGSGVGSPEREREGLLSEPPVPETQFKSPPGTNEPQAPPEGPSRQLMVGVGVAIAGVIGVGAMLMSGAGSDSSDDELPPDLEVVDSLEDDFGEVAAAPPPPVSISVVQEGDRYQFSWDEVSGASQYAVTPDGSSVPDVVTVTSYDTDATCIEVESVGSSGLVSAPTRGCAS